jgi:hypothetical protein
MGVIYKAKAARKLLQSWLSERRDCELPGLKNPQPDRIAESALRPSIRRA